MFIYSPAVSAGAPLPTPVWWKTTLAHTAFQTAGVTKQVQAFTVPPQSIVHGGILKCSQAFAGSMVTYSLSLGTAALPLKYAAALNALGAVSDSGYSTLAGLLFDVPDYTDPTPIFVTATSTLANLNTSTQGSVDIWLQVSVLP